MIEGMSAGGTPSSSIIANIASSSMVGVMSSITILARDSATSSRQSAICSGVPRSKSIWRMRSEEHTSELQSLMRISYAVFCLKKKNIENQLNYKQAANIHNKHKEHNTISS